MLCDMAEKKLVESITSMEEDFAKWYTDVVKKAELVSYGSVKGCVLFTPFRIICVRAHTYHMFET